MWLRIDTTKLLWMNENIKLLFVDFSFLGMKGEDTETPTSLRKPETPDEKCEFNFYKSEKQKLLIQNCKKYIQMDV